MQEEGYIKFNCQWEEKSFPFPDPLYCQLEEARQNLWARKLIGTYPDGIGFGNLSLRVPQGFIITGSATGHRQKLGKEHYSLVVAYDYATNFLACEGLVKASSESLSHAAIYDASPEAMAVVHIHSLSLWEKHRDQLPTTAYTAQYGTPEMALELKKTTERSPLRGIAIMGGHKEGIISYAENLEQNIQWIDKLFK